MPKVTATVCVDGKRHNWRFVEQLDDYEHRWCDKCGCRTEFLQRRNQKTNKSYMVRCKDSDGKPYIEIPKHLK